MIPRPMTAARTEISRRELAFLVVGACLLSVMMNWPLILNLGTDIPRDIGDPLVQSWQIAWGGHALGHQPLDFFQANHFWPLPDTLAFSDALIGYAPAGLIGDGPKAAVARYDLMFMFAYALVFVGAYLLARELGLGPGGAAVAGAACAFAPYRLEQDGHMQVISSGGVPLSLALGVRGYRLAQPGWVVAAFCVAAWQLSLGFSVGLPFAHLLGILALIAVIYWLRAGRPPLERRLVVATVVGLAIFGGVTAVISRPYVRVADAHPQAHRSPEVVEEFSGPAKVFIVAPRENSIWGDRTEKYRVNLQNPQEKTLFPGLVILVLAGIGLGSPVFPRGLRIGLGVGVLVVSVLALGFQVEDGLRWPYRVVYEVNPLWEAIRVPGRLLVFSSLGLALLAGAGAHAVGRALARRVDAAELTPRAAAAPTVLAALLAAAIVIEGRGLPFDPYDDQDQPPVPYAPARVADVPTPQLHLPAERAVDNRRYVLWSTDGFPAMVNGRSSLIPAYTDALLKDVHSFPDRRSVAQLKAFGIRSVIFYTRRLSGTPWEGAADRSVAGLGLIRRERDGVVIYEIPSLSAGPGESNDSSAGSDRRSL